MGRQACRFLSASRIRVADSGLDRYLMKKSGSKRVSESQAALKGGKKMLDKLNARRNAAGKVKSAQRQQLRQQIRMVVTSDSPQSDKDKQLKSLKTQAQKLEVPKDKLKMWLGQDCASYMLYVDGPNGAFAVLEIVDTLYDQNKVVKILSPLLDAKSHSSHFKGLWKINLRRDEYLDHVGLITVESELCEDDITEIGLELDVLDVMAISDNSYQFKTDPKSLNEIKGVLEKDYKSSLSIVSSELTYVSANPIELEEADLELVELFEEKIHQVIAKSDIHFELGNIYYNFDF